MRSGSVPRESRETSDHGVGDALNRGKGGGSETIPRARSGGTLFFFGFGSPAAKVDRKSAPGFGRSAL
jgi:hypothetical protein